MIRVIGPRALIKPCPVTPRSSVLEVTDRQVATAGEVIAVGKMRCDCGAVVDPGVRVGAIVLVPPTVGQEVSVDGEDFWLVALEDLGAEWEPEDEPDTSFETLNSFATEPLPDGSENPWTITVQPGVSWAFTLPKEIGKDGEVLARINGEWQWVHPERVLNAIELTPERKNA